MMPTACYVSTLVLADGSSIDRYGQRTPPVGVEHGPACGTACERQPEHRGSLGRRADRHGRSARREWRARAAQRGAGGCPQRSGSCRTGPLGVVPLFSPAAASRLFIGRVPLTEAGQAAATAAAAQPNPSMRCEPIGILRGLELRQSGQSHHAGRQDHQARVRQVRLRAHDSPRSDRASGESHAKPSRAIRSAAGRTTC